MRKTATTLTALGLISALVAAAPTQAEAHDWSHRGGQEHQWRGHHNSGAALGILGGILAGAAIASSHPYAPPTYYAPGYGHGSNYGTPYGYAGYGYYR